MVLLRTGYVIVINGIMAFIVRKFSSIPYLVKETGRKTLMLYVVHVVILYGCAWFPGFYKFYAKSFNPLETIIATMIMFGAMFALVMFSYRFRMIKKISFAYIKRLGINERI